MNRFAKQTLFALFGAMLTFPAFAQARHDEKPHGMMTTAQDAAHPNHMSATGGRHDEGGTTHGHKRPPPAVDQSRKSDKPTGQ